MTMPSITRRSGGIPTLNALYNHQVSVIAGDFLYLRALRELARLGDLEIRYTCPRRCRQCGSAYGGELLQLAAGDPLSCQINYNAPAGARPDRLGAACALGALCWGAGVQTGADPLRGPPGGWP